jgi:hypothetical protein
MKSRFRNPAPPLSEEEIEAFIAKKGITVLPSSDSKEVGDMPILKFDPKTRRFTRSEDTGGKYGMYKKGKGGFGKARALDAATRNQKS